MWSAWGLRVRQAGWGRATLTGTVKAVDESAGSVEVEIAGKNSWGNHVTGSVTVALPVALLAGS